METSCVQIEQTCLRDAQLNSSEPRELLLYCCATLHFAFCAQNVRAQFCASVYESSVIGGGSTLLTPPPAPCGMRRCNHLYFYGLTRLSHLPHRPLGSASAAGRL